MGVVKFLFADEGLGIVRFSVIEFVVEKMGVRGLVLEFAFE